MAIIIDSTVNYPALAVHGAFYATSEGINGIQHFGFGNTVQDALDNWNLINADIEPARLPLGYSVVEDGGGFVAWDNNASAIDGGLPISGICSLYNVAVAAAWKNLNLDLPKLSR